MSLTAPRKDCPPAYGGCTCSCHRVSGITHLVPCCRPSKLNMPTDPEWYREKAKLEEGCVISAGAPDHFPDAGKMVDAVDRDMIASGDRISAKLARELLAYYDAAESRVQSLEEEVKRLLARIEELQGNG